MNQQHGSSVGYEFAQPPAAVPHKRQPYRDPLLPPEREPVANIMFDRRVVRGNTYAAQVLPPSSQAEAERRQMEAEARARQRELATQRRMAMEVPRTPSPVGGRRHIDVQTENYLEELSDRVPEVEEATQTEAFMDRPPSPLFIPTKTGEDASTQILPGDLFDFDLEVAPILEVLVGKTLEQSLMEVLEEEELENIRKHQEEFEQIRNAELADVQRLEEEVKRKQAEKNRRVEQERARMAAESDLRQKVAAQAFASNYLTNLSDNVFGSLVDEGHFFDPLTAEVEEEFMPMLMERVTVRLKQEAVARELADDVIRHMAATGRSKFEEAQAQRAAEEAERLRIEAEAQAAAAEAEAAAKAAAEAAAAAEEDE